MREPGRRGERQLARPGRAPHMVLVEVREHGSGEVGSRKARLGQPITELADLGPDRLAVAEEARAEPGVDDRQPSGRLDDQTVVAAGQRRPIRSLRSDGVQELRGRHAGTWREEAVEAWLPRRLRLAVADNGAVQPADREA